MGRLESHVKLITCQLSQSLSLEQPLTLDFDTNFQYYFHHFSNHFHSDFRLFFSVGYLLMSEGSPSQQGSRSPDVVRLGPAGLLVEHAWNACVKSAIMIDK